MAHSSLCRDSHQKDFGADLQMSRQKCNINQQRRGRRRAWRGPDGICGSFSLAIFVLTICMAHTSSTVAAIESSTSSSSGSTSPTIVMVAVTPSIGSSGGNSNITTEAPPEQQQPQGQCLLDGQWVPETTVHCEKHTSCRAIQRTGHCCPDYKCDCEKDGKTYANGYKLVDPDTPCTVCYCKGGEVVCSSVTCFRRDDCMPKYVPGRCCPEYDNCPILDNNPPLSSETSSTSTTTSTQKPAGVAQSAGFNWNITIKEITKPSEIRITDDNKSKSAIPTRKSGVTTEGAPASSAATTTSSNSVASTTDTTTAATATKATTAAVDSTTATEATTTTVVISSTEAATATQLSQDTNPKVLPGTSSSESLKLIAAASAGFIGRPQSGNEVEQNTKLPADGPLPFAENDPSKVSFKREFTTERPSTQGYEESGAVAVAVAAEAAVFIEDASAELPDGAEQEPDTAGSDNIYHIISTTEGPSSSSPLPGSSSPKGRNGTEADMSTEGPGSSTEMPPMSSTQHMDADEDVPQVESNPAYPSLPEDDFSLRDVNFPLVDLEDIADSYAKDEPRSILRSPFEVDNKRTKVLQDSTVDGSGSGSGSGDMEPYLEESSTVGHSKERSSMVPLLMYSAEDNSGETRFQNASDLQLENVGRRQKESESSEELMGRSGEIKEPTTPRTNPSTALDIDELGSGAGQLQASSAVDPKADAESLKLDESQETIAKMTSADDKSSVRAEKSLVELAMPLGRLYLQRIY
ncbi:serine-rich adhesin for platelets [Drosophila madeirensis]|uniref:Serine-rich adhesin for platelets n=1 Tax=Drosophila madeirensis TaxID=30013 RepID=A0AAU9FGU5_DROMD